MLQKISTDKAPAAIGPYSQGIVLGNIFFASGQIPIDPATGEIHGTTIEEQAEQVMKNIGELLKAAGTGHTRVAKTSCFLADMGDFAAFNQVYAKYFTENPARSCVAVKTLPKNVLCEGGDTEGSGNALPQQITGEEIRHILRFPSGLFHDHVDCVLLEITFRLFPGLTAEEIILSHHVEQGA